MTVVLRGVEVSGRIVDVRVHAATITAMAPRLEHQPADEVIDGGGGALIPGLHDHHIHLAALAAWRQSVLAGPPDITTADALAAALRRAADATAPGEWVRAVGYHESVAGPLDRWRLDDLAGPTAHVRVQHRSGAMWVLSSAAVDAAGIETADHPGIERDGSGRATGRLFRMDDWLRAHITTSRHLDLASVGRLLASRGCTGVTDMTPSTSLGDVDLLASAVTNGDLPLRVTVTGGSALASATFPASVTRGPVKIIVPDHDLPDLSDLTAWIGAAHAAGRPVAVHCVTREALVLALAAWEEAGCHPDHGDRVEHGAVVPPELAATIAARHLTVVTQPGFVAARGDDYLRDVDPDDVPHLYPCASLLAAGVRVGGSTDAPFGPADPWTAIAAAINRTTTSTGAVIGPGERVSPQRALDLFLTGATDPGGAPRRIEVGAAADLCLLGAPLADELVEPSADHVEATICAGQVTFARDR